MAVDVRPVVLIRRSRHDVAAFMFDPGNDLRWTGGITASRPAQPGPLVAGATVERTAKFLGRSFTYGYVVTEHQPDHLLELKVERPFPMLVRYELRDADEGTLVAIHAERDTRWLLRLGNAADGPPGPQEHHRRPRTPPRLPRTVTRSRPACRFPAGCVGHCPAQWLAHAHNVTTERSQWTAVRRPFDGPVLV